MQKNISQAIFVSVCVFCFFSCGVDSCMADKYWTESYPLPEAVFLRFVAENNLDTPVTIRIRHYYHFTQYSAASKSFNSQVVYSEWEEYALAGRETKNIGSDIWDEMPGFNLLKTEFWPQESFTLISSFEVEIRTAENAYSFVGYPANDGRGLCFFKAIDLMPDFMDAAYPAIETKTQTAKIRSAPFVLPVKLAILANGGYVFSNDTIFTQYDENGGLIVSVTSVWE